MNYVLKNWHLDEHHMKLLVLAAQAFDRAQEARALVNRDGVTVADRYNVPKAHPALTVERDSRIAFCRCLRELQLDVEGPEEPRVPRFTTPPMLYGKAERQER